MARLPDYTNERSISTGSEFMRARSVRDQTSAGMRELGSSIANVGERLFRADQQLEAKARADAERTQKLEAEAEVIRFDGEARLELRRQSENLSETGSGFYDGYMTWYDQNWQSRVNALPPERRMEAQNAFLRQRNAVANQAASIESGRRNEFTVKVAGEKRDSLINGVKAGEMPYDLARQEVDRFVSTLGLPENASNTLRRGLSMAVEGAHIERAIAMNPDGALRDLRRYSPGNARSSNPNVQVNIEAAQRHGIPLDIMLPIIQGESAFNPNVDMSKKINPQTGRPYSSAYGFAQFLDSTWKEVGMTKSADPAVQAEAAARLMRKRIETLQSNGIEVNLANVYSAHLLGPGAFVAMNRVDPNTPLRDVLLPLYGEGRYRAATTGNGTLLQDGATVGQTLARVAERIGTKAREASALYTTEPGDTGPLTVGGVTLETTTAADLPRYTAKAIEASAQLRDEQMKAYLKQQADDGLFNPFTRGDRTAMDKHAASTGIHVGMNQGDTNSWGAARSFVNQHQYLPKPFAEEASLAILSPDPAKRTLGYDLLAHVELNQPLGGLRQSGVQTDIKKRVERFVALQTELGMDSRQAREMVEREFAPEFAERVKRDEKRTQQIIERQSASAFEDYFESQRLFWPINYTEYGTEGAKQRMLSAFQDRVRYHLNDGASETTAIAAARRDMSRAYGVDNSFGDKRLMHWPPNKLLPAGEDGTHKWVGETVTQFVNDTLTANNSKHRVRPVDVFLIGTPETGRTAMTGQPIHYEVWFRDERRNLQALPGGYKVDPAQYRDRLIQARLNPQQRAADVAAARREQQRQDALMVSPSPAGAALYTPPQ
jgi:hypothetical protein